MSINEMKDMLSEDVDKVVEHPLLFKKKLNIGEEAYKYLSNANNLRKYFEIAGIGVAVGSIAAFGWISSLGVIGQIGVSIGLVTTPVGWFALAGVGGAGLAFGIKKMFQQAKKETMDEIPKFISTPLDVLAMNISQILLPISLKIAFADSEFSYKEKDYILAYFISDWGYNRSFIERAIDDISKNINSISFDVFKNQLNEICSKNKDLKYDVIKTEILSLIGEIIKADGKIHSGENNVYKEFERIL